MFVMLYILILEFFIPAIPMLGMAAPLEVTHPPIHKPLMAAHSQ